jgi:hypothetical protein
MRRSSRRRAPSQRLIEYTQLDLDAFFSANNKSAAGASASTPPNGKRSKKTQEVQSIVTPLTPSPRSRTKLKVREREREREREGEEG